MNKIIELRDKWDEIFVHNRVFRIIIRLIGALFVLYGVRSFVVYAGGAQNFLFGDIVNDELAIGLSIAIAFLYYFFPEIGTVLYSIIFLVTYCGVAPILLIIATIFCWVGVAASEIASMVIVLTPICVVIGPDTFGIGTPYLLFSIGAYCAIRLSEKNWRYAFAVYYSIMGIVFGIYGSVIDYAQAPFWGKDGAILDIEGAILQCGSILTPILLTCITNIAIVFILGKLIDYDGTRFAGVQLDIRDAICFAICIFLLILSNLVLSMVSGLEHDLNLGNIIIQVAIGYVITRPIASYQVSNQFILDDNRNSQLNSGSTIDKSGMAVDLITDITSLISIYLNEKKFNGIMAVGELPVNVVMLFGNNELDKQFVVKNISKMTNQTVEILDAVDLIRDFRKNQKLKKLESLGNRYNFSMVYINHFDQLFEQDSDGKIAEILCDYFDTNSKNSKMLYFVGVDDVSKVSPEYISKTRINKYYYVTQNDSITFNDTYVVVGLLGKGGSGTVYKAYHKRLKNIVAMKKVTSNFVGKVSNRNEVDLLKIIKHMYLPKVYDVFEHENDIYTVMDFVPGESFQDMLNRGIVFEERDIIFWAKQLTDAVYYLHSLQPAIIHSDIKPGNIMLTPKRDICLIDFNISTVFDSNNFDAIGTTPGYSPIEQYGDIGRFQDALIRRGIILQNANERENPLFARNDENSTEVLIDPEKTEVLNSNCNEETTKSERFIRYDDVMNDIKYIASSGISNKTDIYSIGATLYALVTGEKPSVNCFDVKPIKSLRPDCSDELVEIIRRCMMVNPKDRYDTVQDLRRELDMISFHNS